MRKPLQVLAVIVVSFLVLVTVEYVSYHRPYVPTFQPNTEVLFCHTAGDGVVELGIRSAEYPTHQVPLLRIVSDKYDNICDAWLHVDEELPK